MIFSMVWEVIGQWRKDEIDQEKRPKQSLFHPRRTVKLICTVPNQDKVTGTCFMVQFSSVTQLCPTLCEPMNRRMPGLPVHHQLPEFTQTHVRVGDAIQPSHPLSSPSPPAPNPSQHQSLFQWVNSLHDVAIMLKLAIKLKLQFQL